MANHKHSRLYLAVLAGIASLNAHAVGLGDINVRSALNEPLRADVAMIRLDAEEADKARITFRTSGPAPRGSTVDSLVSTLQGRFVAQGDGRYSLQITSRESIREPVLSFYVEVALPKVNVGREFTVLLDPPATVMARDTFGAAPLTAEIDFEALERSIDTHTAAPGTKRKKIASVTKSAIDKEPNKETARRTVPQTVNSDGTYGPVVPGDTLWGIATRLRPSRSISVQQMITALHHANPDAFIENNVDRLLAGVKLRVPTEAEIVGSAPAAVVEMNTPDTVSDTPTAVTSTTQSFESQDSAPEATPQSDTATAPTAEVVTLNAQVDALTKQVSELEAISAERELKMMQMQIEIDLLRAQTQALATAPSQEARPLEDAAAPEVTPPLVSATTITDTGNAAAMTGKIATPDSAAAPTGPAATQLADNQESKPDDAATSTAALKTDSKTTAGLTRWLLGGALALAGAVLFWQRRRALAPAQPDPVWTDREAQDAKLLAEVAQKAKDRLSDVDGADTIADEGATLPSWISRSDSDDQNGKVVPLKTNETRFEPIFKEVDLQLAYQQFGDAETLLRSALNEFPNEPALEVKLAEVYATAGNIERFLGLAVRLSDKPEFRNSEHWQKLARMGERLCPTHPLFEYTATVEFTPEEYSNIISRA